MGKQDHQRVTKLLATNPKVLLLLAVLWAPNLASAQAYRPMLTPGSRWGQFYAFESYTAWVFQVGPDTVVNGITYKNILRQGHGSCDEFLLREDTAERKVYFYRNSFEGEQLLYDFSLSPDAVQDVSSCDFNTIRIDSISGFFPPGFSTTIAQPRFFHGHRVDVNTGAFIWLEGVGSLNGLVTPTSPDDSMHLTCHSDSSGVVDLVSDMLGTDSCFMVYSGNAIRELSDGAFRLYPNPTSGVFSVASVQDQMAGSFRIHDIAGRSMPLVALGQQSQGVELNISGQPPGLYMLRYQNESGAYWSAPIVKE